MRRWLALAALLLLVAAASASPSRRPAVAPPSEDMPGSYSRAIDLPAAGWMRVLLPPGDIARCGPNADGVRVFDASGQEVPSAAGPYWPSLRSGKAPRRLPAPAVVQGSAECSGEGTFTVCRPSLPGPGQVPVRLDLELPPNGGSGFWLFGVAGREVSPAMGGDRPPGTWIVLAEGAWQSGQRGRIEVAGSRESLRPVDGLRLELYGLSPRPSSVGYRLELAPVAVLFYAPAAGRYFLGLGGTTGYQGVAAPEVSAQEDAEWLEPGPLEAKRLSRLPTRVTTPTEALDEASFGSSWQVEARDAAAGDVVRIEIPDRLYVRSPQLADLRLVAAGREVPYLLWHRGEPVRVGVWDGLTLDAQERRWPKVRLPFLSVPLSSALITTYPAVSGALSLRSEDRKESAADFTRCDSRSPLSCRRTMSLEGSFAAGAPPSLSLGVSGEVPAGARCDLSLWRRRDNLVFVWPAAAEVRLLANHRDLGAPSYDLQAIAPELAGRPWKLGVLGKETAPHWPAWRRLAPLALIAALLFAALVRLSAARAG